jgi:hypothetical protein
MSWQERILRLFFPAFRMETGVVFSILAFILIHRVGGYADIVQDISRDLGRGKYEGAIGGCLLLLLMALVLCIPIANVVLRLGLFHRFPGAAMFGSVVVLMSICGWMAQEHLQQLWAGGVIFGVPVNGVMAAFELGELAVLCLFAFSMIEFPTDLVEYLGPKEPSYRLLTIQSLLAIPAASLDKWVGWISEPVAAFAALHLAMIAAIIWRAFMRDYTLAERQI